MENIVSGATDREKKFPNVHMTWLPSMTINGTKKNDLVALEKLANWAAHRTTKACPAGHYSSRDPYREWNVSAFIAYPSLPSGSLKTR
jgi:hypothetical protein